MKCLKNNVILAMPGKKKQEGSIIMPDKAQDEGDAYEVLMMGPEAKGVHVGDTVLRPDVSIVVTRRGQDCDLEVDGRKCVIVEDADIRVVLSEAAGIEADRRRQQHTLQSANVIGLGEVEGFTRCRDIETVG